MKHKYDNLRKLTSISLPSIWDPLKQYIKTPSYQNPTRNPVKNLEKPKLM